MTWLSEKILIYRTVNIVLHVYTEQFWNDIQETVGSVAEVVWEGKSLFMSYAI